MTAAVSLWKDKITLLFRKEAIFLLALFLFASFLRLYGISEVELTPLVQDDIMYDGFALNMASGKGFMVLEDHPSAWRAPGYPVFLAGIYYVFGHSYLAVRIIQGLLSAVTCLIVYFIGKEVFNRKVAVISSLIVALYIDLILYVRLLFAETLAIFLLTLGIFFILRMEKSKKYLLLSGLFWGLAILTRPNAPTLLPGVGIGLLIASGRSNIGRTVKRFSIICILVALSLTPWIVRNYLTFNAFIPLTSQTGSFFLMAANPYASGNPYAWGNPAFNPYVQEVLSDVPPDVGPERYDIETGKMGFKAAIQYIEDNPLDYLLLELEKIPFSFTADRDDNLDRAIKPTKETNELAHLNVARSREGKPPVGEILTDNRIKLLLHPIVILLPLWLLGVVFSWKKEKKASVIFYAIIAFMLSALLFYMTPRYRMMLVPLLAVFAAYGLYSMPGIVSGIKSRDKGVMRRVKVASLLIAALFANFIFTLWGYVSSLI